MSTALLQLKVKNYRSFYDEQIFNFHSGDCARPVTAIYGPNASGKSNVAMALLFVWSFIINSNNANLTQIPFDPFLLKKDSVHKPSSFEIEFLQDGRHFVYGFSLTPQSVQHEYLREYASSTNKARTIFERKEGTLNPTAEKYGFGKRLFDSTRSTSLLITKAHENNNVYANIVFKWTAGTNVLLGKQQNETINWSIQQLRLNPELAAQMLELLKKADLWIRSFRVVDVAIPQEIVTQISQLPLNDQTKKSLLSSNGQASSIKTIHAVRDRQQKIIGEQMFDLNSQESAGTQKFFSLAAPIIDTLVNGKTLYIDEFNAYLHPDLCEAIVATFKSAQNHNGAQLILNAHDTSLMGQRGLLEREDILFVEKNYAEESIVVALSDKAVRTGESFEKRYRQGLYGAKPQIDRLTD